MQILKISLMVLVLTISISAQWFKQNGGTLNHLTGVSFIDSSNGWICGFSGTILRTTNGGDSWTLQPSNTSVWMWDIVFTDLNDGIVVGGDILDDGIILRTTNGGSEWIIQSDSTTNVLYAVDFINESVGIAVGTIYKTTNGGANWIKQTSTITDWLYSVSFADENNIMAGGHSGLIFKSSDGGVNWIKMDSLFGPINDIDFIDVNTATAVGAYIYRTTDSGINWVPQFGGLLEFFYGVYFTDQNNGTVVGGQSGFLSSSIILHTTNGGENWVEQLSPTTDQLSDITFYNSEIGSAVGFSGLIIRTTNSGVSFIDEDQEFLEGFSLSQNYPNPFNPTTTIGYQLPERSLVTIKVYDLLGREVTTLVNEEKPAGSYEVQFNTHSGEVRSTGGGLTSGIYFYQLKAGDYTETRKMILIK